MDGQSKVWATDSLLTRGTSVTPDGLPGEFFLPTVTFFSFSQFTFSVKQSHFQGPGRRSWYPRRKSLSVPDTHYLPILWIWSFRCRELTLPIGKGEASLWLHARFSGLRKATREQAITCYPLEHVSRAREKETGNPNRKMHTFWRSTRDASPSSREGAPWRTSLHDLARNHRRERKLLLFCFVLFKVCFIFISLIFLSVIKTVYSKSL